MDNNVFPSYSFPTPAWRNGLAHPASVENLDFPHKNISGWLKILTRGSHCPQKLRDRSLASALRHRYGIKNVSRGFAGLIVAAGRACRTGRREGWRGRARAGVCPDIFPLSLPPPGCHSPGTGGATLEVTPRPAPGMEQEKPSWGWGSSWGGCAGSGWGACAVE